MLTLAPFIVIVMLKWALLRTACGRSVHGTNDLALRLFVRSFVRLVMKSGGGADNLRHDKAQKGDDNKYEEEEEEEEDLD